MSKLTISAFFFNVCYYNIRKDREVVKKSSKIVIIVLIIIITFSLGTGGGYLLFKNRYESSKNNTLEDNNNNNNNNPENKQDNYNNSKDDSSIKEENINTTDNTVQKLYNRKTNFHTTNKVTYDTLSDQLKLSVDLDGLMKRSFSNLDYKNICAKLKNSGNSIMQNAYQYCLSVEAKYEGYADLVTYYDLEEVRNNNIKYFNESNKLPKTYGYVNTVSLEVDSQCGQVVLQEKDNYYLSYDSQCGYGGLNPITKRTLLKAVKYGDELYIYDNFIVGTLNNSENNYVNYDFYTDDSVSNKVTNYKFKETDDGNYNIEVNDILKYMKTFKHTYKLNSNNEYYWVSSEPVSSIN